MTMILCIVVLVQLSIISATTSTSSCPSYKILCKNKECVNGRYCDGDRDCNDGTDEKGCPEACVNAVTLKRKSGTISSLGYPKPPTAKIPTLSCTWIIPFDHGDIIEIKFKDVDVGKINPSDWSSISLSPGFIRFDGDAGEKVPEQLLFRKSSHVQSIRITFRSDLPSNSTLRGFQLMYRVLQKRPPLGQRNCGEVLTANSGSILSPNYPQNYSNNANCIWDINLEPTRIIQLTLHTDLPSERPRCHIDFVEIIENPDDLGRRWCTDVNFNIAELYYSSKLKILFKSDHNVSAPGFNATYTSFDLQVDIAELDKKFNSVLVKLRATVNLAAKIEQAVLSSMDKNDLVLVPKIYEFSVIVDLLNTSFNTLQRVDFFMKTRSRALPSSSHLEEILVAYKLLILRRAEFAILQEKELLSGLVKTNLLTQLRRELDDIAQTVLEILLSFAKMEQSVAGSVIPGMFQIMLPMKSINELKESFQNLFKETAAAIVKSLNNLEGIENVYSNYPKFIGNAKSTTPYIHIAKVAASVVDVSLKLNDLAIMMIRNSGDRKIKLQRGIVEWFKDANGYMEISGEMEVWKNLLLKISKYRDMKKSNGVTPQKFFDTNLGGVQMLADDRVRLVRLADEL